MISASVIGVLQIAYIILLTLVSWKKLQNNNHKIHKCSQVFVIFTTPCYEHDHIISRGKIVPLYSI